MEIHISVALRAHTSCQTGTAKRRRTSLTVHESLHGRGARFLIDMVTNDCTEVRDAMNEKEFASFRDEICPMDLQVDRSIDSYHANSADAPLEVLLQAILELSRYTGGKYVARYRR